MHYITWASAVTEEHRLRLPKNSVLRKIYLSKTGDFLKTGYRKLHNVDVHNLYSSPCLLLLVSYTLINEKATGGGHLACIVKKNGIVYRGLVRKAGKKDRLENLGADGKMILR